MALAALAVLAALVGGARGDNRPLQEIEINLDLDPEQRFVEVVGIFNESIWNFYNDILDEPAVETFLLDIVKERGDEPEELQREIKSLAALTNLPEYGLQAIQFIYELQTVMVPFVNVTIPWRGPGCTGIIARNKADGMVYHARNQDFSLPQYMQALLYTGVFTKGGEEVFRAQMLAGYLLPLTALKKGANGFSFEANTRYTDHVGGNEELLRNLLEEKRPLNLWTARKALEGAADYEEFVETLSTAEFAATIFNIIAGVQKGTILARNPDGLAYKMTLGEENFECREDYIIITNFDSEWHDIKEWFDPTAQKGYSRRTHATALLNGTENLTPEFLTSVISDDGVMAPDTIFQSIVNVEAGTWDAWMPDCVKCSGPDATTTAAAAVV